MSSGSWRPSIWQWPKENLLINSSSQSKLEEGTWSNMVGRRHFLVLGCSEAGGRRWIPTRNRNLLEVSTWRRREVYVWFMYEHIATAMYLQSILKWIALIKVLRGTSWVTSYTDKKRLRLAGESLLDDRSTSSTCVKSRRKTKQRSLIAVITINTKTIPKTNILNRRYNLQ